MGGNVVEGMESSCRNGMWWLAEASGKKGRAVGACSLLAFGYVALLYAPALFLPRPKSIQEFMLRRIACAAVASMMAPFICFKLLPVHLQWDSDRVALLEIFGVTTTHLWQGAVIPTLLTASLYLGPLSQDLVDFIQWFNPSGHEYWNGNVVNEPLWSSMACYAKAVASDVLWWRNFLVAPISEEMVFRACMVPLLLCGGFSPSAVIFICPMFFALAHVHHLWELVYGQRLAISTAMLIVGLQLGYTTLFGWYATFLYLRTGHLSAPLVAHMFCNIMGLPRIGEASASRQQGVLLAYLAGLIGFFALLGPMSNPALYNNIPISRDCSCWLGYCKWRLQDKIDNSSEIQI